MTPGTQPFVPVIVPVYNDAALLVTMSIRAAYEFNDEPRR